MARLGSGDSPVSGQEFELPAGAQLAEDSGDLVIQDSGGNVVFRRDEANSEWVGDSLSIEDLHTTDRDPKIVVKKDDSGTVHAIGETDEIASGSDATTVIQAALDNLTSGRSAPEKVLLKGDFETNARLEYPSNIHVELQGRVTLADGSDVDMTRNKDPTNGNSDVIFEGGIWDGNGSNQSTDQFIFPVNNVTDATFINVTAMNASRDAFLPTGGSQDITYVYCRAIENNLDGFNPLDSDGIIIDSCIARGNGGQGIHPSDGCKNVTVSNCISRDSGQDNYSIRADNCVMSGCIGLNPGSSYNNVKAHHNSDTFKIDGGVFEGGNAGIEATDGGQLGEFVITGGVSIRNTESWGLILKQTDDAVISECHIDGPTSGFDAINLDGSSDVTLREVTVENANGNDLSIDSGMADLNVRDCDFNGTVADSGTRTRWNGVIGGGPLGGTDIGSLTGADEGIIARSNGTNASATADELFILKSGGDWQSIADPSTTITPS